MSAGALVVLIGDVAPTSLVAQQLQLRSFFSLRLKNQTYLDDLRLEPSAPAWTLARVILGADAPTVGQLVEGLNRVAPDWRERDDLILYPAALYFVDPQARVALLTKALASSVSFALRYAGLMLMKISVSQLATRNASLRLTDVPVDISQPLEGAMVNLNDATGLWQVETIHTSARSFNAFSTQLPYVVKTSSHVAKARDEYDFFCQAPAAWRAYLPQVGHGGPVAAGYAYQIEFVPMLDLSRFVIHGSLRAEPDGVTLLGEVGKIFDTTVSTPATVDQVRAAMMTLFCDKLTRRMDELKALPIYPAFLAAIASICPQGLETLVADVCAAFLACLDATTLPGRLVFGHGDLCFSNILYDRLSGAGQAHRPPRAIVCHHARILRSGQAQPQFLGKL